jgi:hypothetical protein
MGDPAQTIEQFGRIRTLIAFAVQLPSSRRTIINARSRQISQATQLSEEAVKGGYGLPRFSKLPPPIFETEPRKISKIAA